MNQIPNIEETHNTREIEEIVEQFEKRMPLITSHGLLLEARLTPTSYLKMKEWLRTTLHQQLQKAREEERERIITILDDYEIDGEWQRNEMLRKIIADIAEINYTDLGKSSL